MSDGDDSIAMSIEDAFAQTLADMEEARDELASSPVESESPSIDSAFQDAVPADISSPSPPDVVEPIMSPIAPQSTSPPVAENSHKPPTAQTSVDPPMGSPPAGPPMMGPPMSGPPAGPPAGPPMMGPPMSGPPAGPPMDSPPKPPSIEPVSEPDDHGFTFQVADLSEITDDIQSGEELSTNLESVAEFDESVVVEESLGEELVTSDIQEEPEFNPIDADDFMSDFQDEWDDSAPVRASDVDRTEGMDW